MTSTMPLLSLARKGDRRCGPRAVAAGARTVRVGISCVGTLILHALDAIVALKELFVRARMHIAL